MKNPLIKNKTKNEYHREWYRNNKEKVNLANKKWRDANPERVKENGLKYRLANREKEKARAKIYRQRPEIKNHYNQYYLTKRYDPEYRFLYTRKKAEGDNREFTLTKKEYIELVSKPCYYCEEIKKESGRGLDRIDNNRGYSKDNVLPACGSCNKTRGDRFTVRETKVMIDALMRYRNEVL